MTLINKPTMEEMKITSNLLILIFKTLINHKNQHSNYNFQRKGILYHSYSNSFKTTRLIRLELKILTIRYHQTNL